MTGGSERTRGDGFKQASQASCIAGIAKIYEDSVQFE